MQSMNNPNVGIYLNVSTHSWLTKLCVSAFLKLSNRMGRNDWNLCFTSFKTLLWLNPQKKELCCVMVVTAPGSWCLARPCSTGQGTPPVLPSHPLCASLWSFSFSNSVYQPSNHSLHSPEQRQPDIFCVFTLWSNLHPIASVQTVQLGRPVVEWHCCGTMMVMRSSNPTGGTASIWKTSREPNWCPYGWCLYPSLLCQKSSINT